MAYLAGVLTLWLASGIIQAFSDNPSGMPEIHCNKDIVAEGDSLTCNCTAATAPDDPSPTPSPPLFWPGYSNTSVLTLDNVRRKDNGKRLNCTMRNRRRTRAETATFILQVAYGPSQTMLEIKGQNSSFVTDGTRSLTLTCEARDTNPTPLYSWGGLCASNTDTCTCKPQPGGDNRVFCTATNPVTRQHSTKSITVDLTHPPIVAPMIMADTNRTVLISGDSLTCTVQGGKPAVASVDFHCTNPTLPDQPDRFEGNSVSSSVVVSTTGPRDTPMVCHCSAVWGPEKFLYAMRAVRDFRIGFAENPGHKPHYVVVFVVLGIVVIIIAIAVIFGIIVVRRRRRQEGSVFGDSDFLDISSNCLTTNYAGKGLSRKNTSASCGSESGPFDVPTTGETVGEGDKTRRDCTHSGAAVEEGLPPESEAADPSDCHDQRGTPDRRGSPAPVEQDLLPTGKSAAEMKLECTQSCGSPDECRNSTPVEQGLPPEPETLEPSDQADAEPMQASSFGHRLMPRRANVREELTPSWSTEVV